MKPTFLAKAAAGKHASTVACGAWSKDKNNSNNNNNKHNNHNNNNNNNNNNSNNSNNNNKKTGLQSSRLTAGCLPTGKSLQPSVRKNMSNSGWNNQRWADSTILHWTTDVLHQNKLQNTLITEDSGYSSWLALPIAGFTARKP